MHAIYLSATAVSVIAFAIYGMHCLFASGMVAEFERFGLSRFRRLTGALEVLAAFGLTAGLFWPPLAIAASAGLTILMVLGVLTRVRVGDPLLATMPAVLLLLVNIYVLVYTALLLNGASSSG